MEKNLEVCMQGMQDRRMDTTPEPVHRQHIDISNPNILEERPYRHRRSPLIVEFGKVESFIVKI